MTEGTIYLLPGQGPIPPADKPAEEPDLHNFQTYLDIWSNQTLLDMKVLLDRAIAERSLRGTV